MRALTNSTGSVTDRYAYDAFGTMLATSGAGTPNAYRFTGEQQDAALGMYYLRARYYQPGSGRLWTRDSWPLDTQNPREWNRYAYVAADPVNGVDPRGYALVAEYSYHTRERNRQAYQVKAWGPGDIVEEALELGDLFATESFDLASDMRLEMDKNPQYKAMGGRKTLGQFNVAVSEIDGVRYAALLSGAKQAQIDIFVRQAQARGLVAVTDDMVPGSWHAEQKLYEYARKVKGRRPMWMVIKAIGVSAVKEGPCTRQCRPWFARRWNAAIPVYWLGRAMTALNTVR